MKKKYIGLGSIVAIALPIGVVVSCANNDDSSKYNFSTSAERETFDFSVTTDIRSDNDDDLIYLIEDIQAQESVTFKQGIDKIQEGINALAFAQTKIIGNDISSLKIPIRDLYTLMYETFAKTSVLNEKVNTRYKGITYTSEVKTDRSELLDELVRVSKIEIKFENYLEVINGLNKLYLENVLKKTINILNSFKSNSAVIEWLNVAKNKNPLITNAKISGKPLNLFDTYEQIRKQIYLYL